MRLVLLMAFFAAVGCARDNSDHGDAQPPPQHASNEPQSLGQIAGGFGLTGRQINVDLTTTPRGDQFGTSSCHAYLPADFVVGEATCTEAPALKATIYGKNTYQFCSDDANVAAKEPEALELAGCESGSLDIAVYPLSPALKITLDK
jgi:hypothetical protein